MQGSDFAAIAVIFAMICGPLAAGAKKGIDEGVTRDTPVVATPVAATTPATAAPAAPAPAPAATPAPAPGK